MTNSLENQLQEGRHQESSAGVKPSWKKRLGNAALKYSGKGLYWATLGVPALIAKDLKKRSFEVYDNQVVFILDNYELFRGETEKSQGLLLSSVLPIKEIFDNNPELFKSRAKILTTKRKPLLRPFGAYTKWYGTDAIRVNTSQRNLDPKGRDIISTFCDLPISVGVDLRLAYRDVPLHYLLAHGGELLQIGKVKDQNERLRLSEEFRTRIDESVISFALGTASEHFARNAFDMAFKNKIDPLRVNTGRNSLRESVGVDITEFTIERYYISESTKMIIHELNLNKKINGNTSNLSEFLTAVDKLNEVSRRYDVGVPLQELLTKFNDYLKTKTSISREISRIPAFVAEEPKQIAQSEEDL